MSSILYLGKQNSGSGTYNLSGGNLSAPNQVIGFGGSGVFTQTGGTNAITNQLFLGFDPGSSGTYALSGSGILSASGIYVGMGQGTGLFTQSGPSTNATDCDILIFGKRFVYKRGTSAGSNHGCKVPNLFFNLGGPDGKGRWCAVPGDGFQTPSLPPQSNTFRTDGSDHECNGDVSDRW